MTNIIKEDNKYIVQTIKKCECREKEEDSYILICTIKERGTHSYSYNRNQDYISKYNDLRNRLYLSQKAKRLVNKAIDKYEKELLKFSDESIDYFYIRNNCYSLLIRKNNRTRIYPFCTANELAHIEICEYDGLDMNKKTLLKLAIQKKDRILTLRLKAYYDEASNKEIKELENLIGKKVLPSLPKEFDRDYSVIKNTIDFEILENSGYKFLHKPYFAMRGCTHDCYSLNPHTKIGIDAALINSKDITFDEYLKIFDESLNEDVSGLKLKKEHLTNLFKQGISVSDFPITNDDDDEYWDNLYWNNVK